MTNPRILTRRAGAVVLSAGLVALAACGSGSSSSTTTGAAGNLTQGQAAVVTATYPCSLAVFGANYASSCSLSAQVTEIIQ